MKYQRSKRRRSRKRNQHGGIAIEECPPNGFHIYLHSLNPQHRLSVTCMQLRDMINRGERPTIFIETPGPHNNMNEHETVIKYDTVDDIIYFKRLVSRPEAYNDGHLRQMPVNDLAPPPAPRLHRQYAMRELVDVNDLISNIIDTIDQLLGPLGRRNGHNNGRNRNNERLNMILNGGGDTSGGFLKNLGSAIGQGISTGIKQAPQEIIRSLRSKGSTYLEPSGSIANYAGNNIQNIIQSHHKELGSSVGQNVKKFLNEQRSAAAAKTLKQKTGPYNITKLYTLKQQRKPLPSIDNPFRPTPRPTPILNLQRQMTNKNNSATRRSLNNKNLLMGNKKKFNLQ